MALEPWDPFREMVTLRDAINQLFQDSFVRPGGTSTGERHRSVALDIADNGNAFEVHATLPGVKPEDVQVTVQGDTLTIRGQSSAEEERKDRNWVMRERRSGSFARSVTLPAAVNADQAQARFENGVLTLTLPKTEQAQAKQIPISGGSQAQQLPSSSGQA